MKKMKSALFRFRQGRKIIFSYPVICKDGKYSIAPDLDIDEYSLESIKASELELLEEREAIKHLL